MKIKIILILIAIPFFVAFADDQTKPFNQEQVQTPTADSTIHQDSVATDSIANPTAVVDSLPKPIITSLPQVPVDTPIQATELSTRISREGGPGSGYNRVNREKATFLVCAGKYSIRANAERHLEALQKMGYSPKLKYDGQKEYWVVLKKVKGISRAEKIKTQFEKDGLTCFIEEE